MKPTTRAEITNWQMVSLSVVAAILASVSKGSECVLDYADFTSRNEKLSREVTGNCVFTYKDRHYYNEARFNFTISRPYLGEPTWKVTPCPAWISFTDGQKINLHFIDGKVHYVYPESDFLSAVRKDVFKIA